MIGIFKAINKGYLNKKYFYGRGIRWMIEDSKGNNVYCNWCGNMANGVVQVNKKFIFENVKLTFRIPICKSHIAKYFPNQETVPCLIEYDKRTNTTKL